MVGWIKESQVILVTGDDGLALPHEWDVIKDNGEIHSLRHCFCSFVLIGLGETEREVVIAGQLSTQ